MLKTSKSYSLLNRKQTRQFNNALKAKRLRISKGILKKRKRHILAKSALFLAICAGVYIAFNVISAYINNANTGTGNNFDNELIFEDNNDNDITFDENGNIVVDPIEDIEKELLLKNLNDKLLNDLNSRPPFQIEQIDEILSISQIPYNLCEEDNEYDKYILSVLFKSIDTIYSLNYLTGEEFKITQNNAQDYMGDFIVFLNKCSLDMCQSMTEDGYQFLSNIENEQAIYVMPYYYGYNENSELTYYIPIFVNDNGNISAQVYHALATDLDAYNLDPLDTLENQLNGGNTYFKVTEFSNDDLKKILTTYYSFKNDITQSEQNDENQSNNK